MIQVYHDAKKLTLSANSFPGRMLTSEMAAKFMMTNSLPSSKSVETGNIQCLFPNHHREFLQSILDSDRTRISEKLTKQALAISLHCDGSVDRTQTNKTYVMAKVVTKVAEELYFLGADEPPERGAKGMLAAAKSACSKTIGKNSFKTCLEQYICSGHRWHKFKHWRKVRNLVTNKEPEDRKFNF